MLVYENTLPKQATYQEAFRIKNVFTNTYGLARSLLAFGTLTTLLFTDSYELFYFFFSNPQNFPQTGVMGLNLFHLFRPEYFFIPYTIACLILLLVISGYLPQITGVLHAWVSFSLFHSVLTVEGGDQITFILTLLLIPVTLFDKRINHWHKKDYFTYHRSEWISYFCYSCIVIIQIQMAIVYFDAGVEKFKVPEWLDGTATYYWINHNAFGAPNWLHAIIGGLFTNSITITLITWGVIVLEILLFTAFFRSEADKRMFFFLGIFFHFLIFIVHGLFTFWIAMTAGLIIYLLPSDQFIEFSFLQNFSVSPKKYVKEKA
jgi:antimicrobial peptide system SdpB family protein